MTIPRFSRALFMTFAILGVLLLVATAGVAFTGTTLFRHLNPVAGWVMVLLPSSPWLLFWVVTAVSGFSRWGSMRFVLAVASPLLIWQGLEGLGYGGDAWVRLSAILFWTRLQGALELVLGISGLISVVVWRLEVRSAGGRERPSDGLPWAE